jgi:hypothetical protein
VRRGEYTLDNAIWRTRITPVLGFVHGRFEDGEIAFIRCIVYQAHSQEMSYTVCYQRGKPSCNGYQEVARSNGEVMETVRVEYEMVNLVKI